MSTFFSDQAHRILDLPIAHPAASGQGGYGLGGEVIYTAHPAGCPSVLVDSRDGAKVVLMSNGSVEFNVHGEDGAEVGVLRGHYDPVEKRETGVPSQDLWLSVDGTGAACRQPQVTSLVNPRRNLNLEPANIKLVKLGDPRRAFWFSATFVPFPGALLETAVAFSLVVTPAGPALLRQCLVRNAGINSVAGRIWSFFNLMGTQRFAYNKSIWYDRGLPLTPDELVVAATVPFSSALQLKRLSARASANLAAGEATCDFFRFVGDSAASSLWPDAVRNGELRQLPGAPAAFNRFSSPTITAVRRNFNLRPGETSVLEEALLYVTAPDTLARFAARMACDGTDYQAVAAAFTVAASELLTCTPDAATCVKLSATASAAAPGSALAETAFHVAIPADSAAELYLNSIWTGVRELYENCRAHGARLADGIELGTRDRAQDMWPMLKDDPARVRADLLHAFSFLYRTVDDTVPAGERRLTRREKLHGMFPRQYPERWFDRSIPVKNDNRPYNDSAIWFADTMLRYLRSTGDRSILTETVPTVRLTAPDTPETSAIIGHNQCLPVWEVLLEIFASYRRQALDSPYGMIQSMYGDWADPVDMFGTGRVGDDTSRCEGRGVLVRLSCHVFRTLTETIDLLAACGLRTARLERELPLLKQFAVALRTAILRWAWEPEGQFVDALHELKVDGSVPAYAAGETGYTLGSRRPEREFDGTPRTVLTPCAWGLAMLQTAASWLPELPTRDAMVKALLANVDRHCFSPTNGLNLYAPPVANNAVTRRLVGRLGMLPPGCAENGEYHHAQVMMHFFRLGVPGQAGVAWEQFKPVLSSARGPGLCGPFDQSSNSYACDAADPHCGAGMNFGLSGSMDWIFELLESAAGLRLNLHDQAQPDLCIAPNLPPQFQGRFSLRRILHKADGNGKFKAVPLCLEFASASPDEEGGITINGQPAAKAEVADLAAHSQITIQIRHRASSPMPDITPNTI